MVDSFRPAIGPKGCLSGKLDHAAELVPADELGPAVAASADVKDKGSAIGVAPSASIPHPVGPRPETTVFSGQAPQGSIDRLLFRGGESDRWPITTSRLQREDLWAKHARVGDADQACRARRLSICFGLCNQEEPGTVRRAVHMDGLQPLINSLLLNRQHGEVALCRRCQRFNDVFQRVAIGPVKQIEHKHRDLRVGQKQGADVPLCQISTHRSIVGEVAVVDECFIESHKGVRSSRMPDLALGGITVVADPNVGPDVVQPVGLDHIIPIADHLQRQQVFSMRQDERPLFAQGGVIGFVQRVAVLIDPFVFQRLARQTLQPVLLAEGGDDVLPNVAKVENHLWRASFQAGYIIGRHGVDVMNVKSRQDVARLHLLSGIRLKIGHGQQRILAQDLLRHAELGRVKSSQSRPASLSVAPVAHLPQRLKQMAPRDRLTAGDADDPAAALRFGAVCGKRSTHVIDQRPARANDPGHQRLFISIGHDRLPSRWEHNARHLSGPEAHVRSPILAGAGFETVLRRRRCKGC